MKRRRARDENEGEERLKEEGGKGEEIRQGERKRGRALGEEKKMECKKDR